MKIDDLIKFPPIKNNTKFIEKNCAVFAICLCILICVVIMLLNRRERILKK